MAVNVGREQRDAIHAEVLGVLTGTGDVYFELERGDYEAARRLRRRFEDAMRLLDDLGWDPDAAGEEFELSMPPGELARVLAELSDNAGAVLRAHIVEPIEEREHAARSLTAQLAYGDLLAQLAGTEPAGGEGGGGS